MSKSIAKILMYITGIMGYLATDYFCYSLFIAIMLNLVLGEISFYPSLLKNIISNLIMK